MRFQLAMQSAVVGAIFTGVAATLLLAVLSNNQKQQDDTKGAGRKLTLSFPAADGGSDFVMGENLPGSAGRNYVFFADQDKAVPIAPIDFFNLWCICRAACQRHQRQNRG